MRVIKYIIIFLLFPGMSNAQEQPEEARFITNIPFKMYSGGVMIIRACFENIPDSLNFILDTGSGGISLDSATCEEFSIDTRITDSTILGIGGSRRVAYVFNKKLQFPGLVVDSLNFHVANYEVLSSVYGEKIDGIIGYAFLRRYILDVNFDSLQIRVFSPGKFRYPGRGHILRPNFTRIPNQELQIKDSRKLEFPFYFDTGAGLCFLMSERFAADSGVLLKKRKPLHTQAEGMAGRLSMRLTVVKEVKIGPYRFRNVPTYLYQDESNVTSYPYSGGLIGNELLRRFNMIINYPKQEIHIVPNTHYNETFDYAYTGLGIYFVYDRILVMDVIKDSPAHLAGFLVDDEIVAVANNFSTNIQEYKAILQKPNQVIKIIVRRGTEMTELYLKTKSIL